MELVIALDNNGHSLVVNGKIKKYEVVMERNEIGKLNIIFDIEDSVGICKCDDYTRIISLPGGRPGVLRVYGASDLAFTETTLEVSYNINEFHASHEDACAAAMKEIIIKETR